MVCPNTLMKGCRIFRVHSLRHIPLDRRLPTGLLSMPRASVFPSGVVKFLSTVGVQLYSGNHPYPGKILVWGSLGVGNLLC